MTPRPAKNLRTALPFSPAEAQGHGMTTTATPMGTSTAKTVRLVPGEGTAQLVEQITIRPHAGRYEVVMANARGSRCLEPSCRTGSNAFPTYAEAAAYANAFIRRNQRRVAR